MNVDHRTINDVLVIDLREGEGRLSEGDIDEFIGCIFGLAVAEKGTIALNLSMKPYLNSTGLSDLIKVKDRLLDRGIEMVLISPTPRVMSLLEMAGVGRFFNIIGSEDKL
ncbi:MAG: STAS domain-containing protein [Spirochaetes bacterium]|nr:STAS domain-containing protein [Spirochaetota bacterium]